MLGITLKGISSLALPAALAWFSAGLCPAAPAQSKTALKGYAFETLYAGMYFGGTTFNGGATPCPGLTMDGSGNLYATESAGGGNGPGTIFEYTPRTNTLATLYSFTGGADGYDPFAGLIMDSSDNLYGTTFWGGVNGLGTVFEYSPATTTFTTLYSFTNDDGSGGYPAAGLVMDKSGNLYGTAVGGSGSIFEYSPATNTFTTLHSFVVAGDPEGADPVAGLIIDGDGNLYGTTDFGGTYGHGSVFKFATAATMFTTLNKFTSLYSFTGGDDGGYPSASLIMDGSGNLYGTAYEGGAAGFGTVFKFASSANTLHSVTTLHSFTNGNDGAGPQACLMMDGSGNLYGTAKNGGSQGYGTVFEFAPATNTFTSLYSFTNGNDGACPCAGLTMDGSGSLYGTTLYGTIFVLHPISTVVPPSGLHHPGGPQLPAPPPITGSTL
jgi:uncharacterized repeat protein (TIGR03803 family)